MYNEAKVRAMYANTYGREEDIRTAMNAYQDGFNAALNLVAMILDITGELGYTADTESGNKIRLRLDSPP